VLRNDSATCTRASDLKPGRCCGECMVDRRPASCYRTHQRWRKQVRPESVPTAHARPHQPSWSMMPHAPPPSRIPAPQLLRCPVSRSHDHALPRVESIPRCARFHARVAAHRLTTSCRRGRVTRSVRRRTNEFAIEGGEAWHLDGATDRNQPSGRNLDRERTSFECSETDRTGAMAVGFDRKGRKFPALVMRLHTMG